MAIGYFLDGVSNDEEYDNIKFFKHSKINESIEEILEEIKTEILIHMEDSYRESRDEYTEHIEYENTDGYVSDLEEVNESIEHYKLKISDTYTSFERCKILNELLEDFELHETFKVRFISVTNLE